MGDPKPYRLDVRMPRRLSERLEQAVQELKTRGRNVTKSALVVIILSEHFGIPPEDEDASSS